MPYKRIGTVCGNGAAGSLLLLIILKYSKEIHEFAQIGKRKLVILA